MGRQRQPRIAGHEREPVRDLHLCKVGYETTLARELEQLGGEVVCSGPGWLLGRRGAAGGAHDLCFAMHSALDAEEARATSVKQLAAALAEVFIRRLGERQVETRWPLLFQAAAAPGLSERGRLLEARWRELVRRRRARVLRLAEADLDAQAGPSWGFFVLLVEPGTAICATEARGWGQRRMRMDPQAPSRSFLKLEEALALLGERPGPGEHVIDLGAAPGGWSYAAARGGAQVLAVDNGALKGAARGHPRISHQRANAFTFTPPGGRAVDWLLCDMIEDPSEVLALLRGWLQRGWCRRFVVNLKFGRGDPLRLLDRLRDPEHGIGGLAQRLIARQLYHDRDELTVMGRA